MNKQQQELYERLLKKVNEFCLGQAAEDVIETIDDLVESYEYTGETPFKELNAIKEQMPKYDEEGTVEISKTDIRNIESALNELETLKETRYVLMGARECGKTFALRYKIDIANKLKALEIIKTKPIVALVDYKYTYEEWLEAVEEREKDLFDNKKEYVLLKEVLTNESTY